MYEQLQFSKASYKTIKARQIQFITDEITHKSIFGHFGLNFY